MNSETQVQKRLVLDLRERGFPALAEGSPSELLDGWCSAVAALANPASPERRALEPALLESSRLSPAGLRAGLRILTWGARREVAERVFERARPHPRPRVTLVILASTPPGLALQPLLAALARRTPVIFKCSSAEPHFAPALLEALGQRIAAVRAAYAALHWQGGKSPELEDSLCAAVDSVVLYGGAAAAAALSARHPGKIIALGPKVSVALVSRDALFATGRLRALAHGLARDTALFDQQGCLSLQAIFTDGDGTALAGALADALERAALSLPPGPLDDATALAIQQERAQAAMAGRRVLELPLAVGTVILDRERESPAALTASPGGRTVRIYQVESLEQALHTLERMSPLLQGAVLAGEGALELAAPLRRLGVNHLARAGRLQRVDALWRNGGLDPLELY